MKKMKEVKAVVRTERVSDLLGALAGIGIDRCLVSHVHSFGAGVDPEDYRVSIDEGGAYSEKVKVELLCDESRVEDVVELIRAWAKTGHRGDGVVVLSDVTDVVSVRTGEHDEIALL